MLIVNRLLAVLHIHFQLLDASLFLVPLLLDGLLLFPQDLDHVNIFEVLRLQA